MSRSPRFPQLDRLASEDHEVYVGKPTRDELARMKRRKVWSYRRQANLRTQPVDEFIRADDPDGA